jgi:integrase/recombinase XerD
MAKLFIKPMLKVVLRDINHHKKSQLGVFFDYDLSLIAICKNLNCSWSNSKKCWYIEKNDKNLKALIDGFKNHCFLDYSNVAKFSINQHVLPPLNNLQISWINTYIKFLKSKRYSESTIKSYSEAISVFLRFYTDKNLSEIQNDDIIRFNNDYILKNKYSASYQNQVVNSIKLFFKVVDNKQLVTELIHRPRREHKLPNVLSKQEVKSILQALSNKKHKMMLCLIYACGLRRSELLNLSLKDVHSERNLLIVRQSKGKKDRIIPIGTKLIDELRLYYLEFKPKTWLFEGKNKGEKYSERSLELVLKKSIIIAKINKPVTLHWLRHSYATHLLESGTDLRYIQELLGHNSSRTTEIYTHVSQKSIQQIRSPFDDL